MKNTLHIFGCSFSKGTGVYYENSEKPQYMWGKKYSKWFWGEQLAKYYGMDMVNHGLGGGSNTTTHGRISSNLSTFKKGDLVFIGLTEPNRVKTINTAFLRKNEPDLEFDVNPGWVNQWIEMEEEDLTINQKAAKWKKIAPIFSTIDTSQLDMLMAFAAYYVDTNKEAYRKYYQSIFTNIKEYLNCLEIKTFLWDSDLWGIGQKINDWWPRMDLTSYGIDDYFIHDTHWSPDGNSNIAMYFMWCVDNNITNIDYRGWHSNFLRINSEYSTNILESVYSPEPDQEMIKQYLSSRNES